MSQPNNPPVFPQIPTGNNISIGPQFGCDIHSHYAGMTLRDYFAAKAIQSLLTVLTTLTQTRC